jgi:hypothetical protein
LEDAQSYTGKQPLLKNHELVMTQDLTDNDIVLRQINYSQIIARLLRDRLRTNESAQCEQFRFAEDFYGDAKYWRRVNICHRVVLLMFLVLCITQRFVIEALLLLAKPLWPLQRLNLMI